MEPKACTSGIKIRLRSTKDIFANSDSEDENHSPKVTHLTKKRKTSTSSVSELNKSKSSHVLRSKATVSSSTKSKVMEEINSNHDESSDSQTSFKSTSSQQNLHHRRTKSSWKLPDKENESASDVSEPENDFVRSKFIEEALSDSEQSSSDGSEDDARPKTKTIEEIHDEEDGIEPLDSDNNKSVQSVRGQKGLRNDSSDDESVSGSECFDNNGRDEVLATEENCDQRESQEAVNSSDEDSVLPEASNQLPRKQKNVQYMVDGKMRLQRINSICGVEKVLFTDAEGLHLKKIVVWCTLPVTDSRNTKEPVTLRFLEKEAYKHYLHAVKELDTAKSSRVFKRRSYDMPVDDCAKGNFHPFLGFQPNRDRCNFLTAGSKTEFRIQYYPWPVFVEELCPNALMAAKKFIQDGKKINSIHIKEFTMPSKLCCSKSDLPTVVELNSSVVGLYCNYFIHQINNMLQFAVTKKLNYLYVKQRQFFHNLLMNSDIPFRHYDLREKIIEMSTIVRNYQLSSGSRAMIEQAPLLTHKDYLCRFSDKKLAVLSTNAVVREPNRKTRPLLQAIDSEEVVELDNILGSPEPIVFCVENQTLIEQGLGERLICTEIQVTDVQDDQAIQSKKYIYGKSKDAVNMARLRVESKVTGKYFCCHCDGTNEKPFKQFDQIKLLTRHMKKVHPETPQPPCPECPIEFTDYSVKYVGTLEYHKQRYHNSDDRFQCIKCFWRFAKASALSHHKKRCKMNNLPRHDC